MSVSEDLQHAAAGDILRAGPAGRAAVYRLYDAHGVLLYVGIAWSPTNRWTEHSSDKPWWRYAASWTVAWFATRQEARAAELAAIKDERPLYNRADNPNRSLAGDRDEEVQRVLDAIDGLRQANSPTARAKRLTQLLDAMPDKQRDVRKARQQAVREMHADGITYRRIAEELGISFGRVRQILAHVEKAAPADKAGSASGE